MFRRRLIVCAALALVAALPANAQDGLPSAVVPGIGEGAVALEASADRVAVLFDDGSVVVLRPDGRRAELRAPRDRDEGSDDAVLRLEGILDGIASSADGEGFEDFVPDEDVETEEPEDDLDAGELSDRLEDALQGERLMGVGGQSAVEAFVTWGRGDRLAVSRADGVWTSEDEGRTWHRLTKSTARAMTDSAAGWVVALSDGEILSDGRRTAVTLGPMHLRVYDLAESDGTVWGATDLGLWTLRAGAWQPSGDDMEEIRHVVADPGWEGGVWTAGPEQGVRRTDDGGLTWRTLGTGPTRVDHASWGGSAPGGALLVKMGSDVWDWREGAWVRFRVPGLIDFGGGEGVRYLLTSSAVLGPDRAAPDRSQELPIPEWIALGDLLHTVLSRRELSDSVSSSRVVQTLMPNVTLEGKYSRSDDTDYLPYSTANTGAYWSALVRLQFTPAGRSSAGDDFDAAVDEVALRTGFDDLGISSDRGLLGAMGGRVGRRASAYRSTLTHDVVNLYHARNALFFERQALPPKTTHDEVIWELRLAELEARLDALTDGAVSAWNLNTK